MPQTLPNMDENESSTSGLEKSASHWQGIREFEVVRKEAESNIISSFYLQPSDNQALPAFKAGQFLTFEFDVPDEVEPVIRQYSLSNGPTNTRYYRISVKREGAPAGGSDFPQGKSSCYLHDCIEIGSVLRVRAPRGQFFLDETSDQPVVLLSGGVGLTPMMSMLETIVARMPDRSVWFIHACENCEVHAFGGRTRELAENCPAVTRHICYRTPSTGDVLGRDFDSEGFITTEKLRQLLPLDNYLFYLCGPGPFMKAMYNSLLMLGVDEDRILYEFFGPATVLKEYTEPGFSATERSTDNNALQPQFGSQRNPVAIQNNSSSIHSIAFTLSGITADWDSESHSILDFAEAQGLQPEFSCRAGVCGTCCCTITRGQVEYFEQPLEPPGENEVLLCCSRPLSDMAIDI